MKSSRQPVGRTTNNEQANSGSGSGSGRAFGVRRTSSDEHVSSVAGATHHTARTPHQGTRQSNHATHQFGTNRCHDSGHGAGMKASPGASMRTSSSGQSICTRSEHLSESTGRRSIAKYLADMGVRQQVGTCVVRRTIDHDVPSARPFFT